MAVVLMTTAAVAATWRQRQQQCDAEGARWGPGHITFTSSPQHSFPVIRVSCSFFRFFSFVTILGICKNRLGSPSLKVSLVFFVFYGFLRFSGSRNPKKPNCLITDDGYQVNDFCKKPCSVPPAVGKGKAWPRTDSTYRGSPHRLRHGALCQC
jgi:hypothetical protein